MVIIQYSRLLFYCLLILFFLLFHIFSITIVIFIIITVKVSFLARDRERTVLMYIPYIYQNDRDEKLNQKKFTLTIMLTVTRQRTKLSLY